jgi:O-antigen/teichoic acid export membrane protein
MVFMNYARQALTGFSWQTLYKGLLMLVALAKISILARLLDPQAFGLFSLTLIALGITESLTQTGVNITILQSQRPVRYFLDSAWVVSILRGFLIGTIMLLLGLFMQDYYQEPQLLALITVTALVPVIKGFINPYIVILHKDLRFFQDSLYRFSLVFVESLVAVGLGILTHSVWAMIWALVAGAIFEVIISFIAFKTRPKFAYLHSRGKTILENAKFLSIATVFNYLNENADNFLLGKLVGTHFLGIYHNAYSLSHKANYDFSKSAHHSTIPVFTKLADKTERLTRAFFKSLAALLAFVIAISLPLLLFPHFFVNLILGSQWLDAVPLLRPLVLAGIVQSISNLSYALFLAKKQYQLMNWHLFSSFILMSVLIIWWGGQAHLLGAVLGILVSRIITLPLVIVGILRATKSK